MRIVMIHPHDLWHDPWTIRILALARRLMKRGHTVDLCHMPRKDEPDHPPIRTRSPEDPAIYEFRPRQHEVMHNLSLLRRLADQADLIHVQKCFPASLLPAVWTSQRFQKPLHYDWDDNETAISQAVEKRFLARTHLAIYELLAPRFASTISYASQAIHQRLRVNDFPEERMAHVPVGADTERFSPETVDKSILDAFGVPANAITILYMGQMEGAAHVRLLIEAAPQLVQMDERCHILLVGGGEQLAEVRSQAEASSVRDHIHCTGYVPHERIPSIVGAADICIACFEDTAATRAKSPLKIAEYLAAGKAIVAHAVGDVPWMIDGCGIKVQPGVEPLVQGIQSYLHNEDRRNNDGRAARTRALELFTWDRGAATLESLYQRALD